MEFHDGPWKKGGCLFCFSFACFETYCCHVADLKFTMYPGLTSNLRVTLFLPHECWGDRCVTTGGCRILFHTDTIGQQQSLCSLSLLYPVLNDRSWVTMFEKFCNVGWSRGTDQSYTVHRCWHDLHYSASFPLMVLAHTPGEQLSESRASSWSRGLSQGCVVSIHLLTAKVKSRNLLRSKGFSRAAPDFMASQICQKNQRC